MDTKLKADIAESAVVTELLKKGWNVLKPYGDRLSYDLVVERNNEFKKIQVKSAWFDKSAKRYKIDVRQTKTNRRRMVRKHYSKEDLDFAIIYIQDLNDFFIIPVEVFAEYKGSLTLPVQQNGNVKFDRAKIKKYRNRWDLLMGSLASNG